MLPALAFAGLQLLTMLVALVLVAQVVAVHPLAAVAKAGTHDGTGVGPVVIGPGQVVSVQPFPAEADDGVHVWTPTFAVLLLEQVMVSHPLPALPVCGVQLCTATFVVLFDEHVVLV